MKSKIVILLLLGISLIACNNKKDLPYLGYQELNKDGVLEYHTIPDFNFVNENGDTVTQKDVANKIYIADFFFSTCPTICPVMKTQMLRIYDKYKENNEVMIMSHSINPKYDTPEVLKKYKDKLGVKGNQWEFLTGTQTDVYTLAQKGYLTSALVDSAAVDDGGFVHSGAFVLVDKDRHIRAIYDGTKEKEVDKLMRDIDLLLSISK